MVTPPPAQHRTNWLVLSILFAVLFSFPLLLVFNRNTLVLGIPLLILYLLLVWLLLIWVIYRFSRRLGNSGGAAPAGRDGEKERP